MFFLLILLGCGGGGGGGDLTGGEGDSPGSDSGGSAGTALEEGGPVDLPAPVAKGLDGIEPSSVAFTPTTGQSGVAGTLSAETIGNVDATVAIIRSGEIYARMKTTGGKVEFEIPTELLGEVLALVVLADDEETVSPPVLVQISETSSGDTVVDVLVTNTGVIQNQRIAVSSDGTIAFVALDSAAGSYFIGTVSGEGGSPSEFVPDEVSILDAGYENEIGSLKYRNNGNLWGIDPESGIVFDTASPLNFLSNDPGNDWFGFSPDDNWGLFAYKQEGTLRVVMEDSDNDNVDTSRTIGPTESPVTSLQFDWLTNDRAIITKEFQDGTFVLQTYDGLNQLRTNPDAALTVTTLLTSNRSLANPQANRADGNDIVCECGQASGTTGLCYYQIDFGSFGTIDSGNVAHPRMAADGSYVVYEKDAGSGLANCAGQINIILNSSLLVHTVATGCYPIPHPSNSDLIAYLKPVDGTLQVGVINLENLGL